MEDSLEQARRGFQAVASGRRVSKTALTVEQAKARLRDCDPGLDIGPPLAQLEEGRRDAAVAAMVPWLASGEARAFFWPVIQQALPVAYRAFGMASAVLGETLQRPGRKRT